MMLHLRASFIDIYHRGMWPVLSISPQKNNNVTSDFFLQLLSGIEDLIHVGVDLHLLLPYRRSTFLLQCRKSLQQMLLDQDVRRLHRLGTISEFIKHKSVEPFPK